jgi:transcriptional regulator with XRE-family HTH domain
MKPQARERSVFGSAIAAAARDESALAIRNFREQVKTIAAQRGMLHRELAEKLDMAPDWFAHKISTRRADDEFIERLAEVLKVDPLYFDVYAVRRVDQLAGDPEFLDVVRRLVSMKPASRKRKLREVLSVLD